LTDRPGQEAAPSTATRRWNSKLPHQAILEQAIDALTVRRVFGEAYELDGATVIPVARVRGGGGGGGGTGQHDGGEGSGSGVAFRIGARPVGVYVIKDGEASWQPALDVGRIGTTLGLAFFAAVSVLGVVMGRSRRQ
jgi:hypothetical protein